MIFSFFYKCIKSNNPDDDLTEDILLDPNSQEVCLLLYIYSIEPPFYAELNKAARSKDYSKIPTLGPYACALHIILQNGEAIERKRDDKIRQGI